MIWRIKSRCFIDSIDRAATWNDLKRNFNVYVRTRSYYKSLEREALDAYKDLKYPIMVTSQ